jgi:hypothetical protein
MSQFISGLTLCEAYYHEVVRPILDKFYPGLAYSAGLAGFGLDVLGFDTPTSVDHLWGPRLYLFLSPEDQQRLSQEIHETLRQTLPVSFRGFTTHFGAPDAEDGGVRVAKTIEHGPVDHLITFTTITDFWSYYLGPDVNPFAEPAAVDWLTFPQQELLSVTAGKIFHDDLGLEAIRKRFAYYPKEVWLYLLAAQWSLIAQEEAFIGRTDQTGDKLGSHLVTARMVERIMHLCFLMEKRYAPYSKWLGNAFKQLTCSSRMTPLLEGALSAATYAEREPFLVQAYLLAAEMHNALGITPPLEARTRTYSDWHVLRSGVKELAQEDPRNTSPHQVIFAERFARAITSAIHDPQVLAVTPGLGSVDQFLVESSNARQDRRFCRSLKDDLWKE